MLGVDPAVLKPWLIRHLEPITDADPATLAEYALALIQRDETPQELERICIENLNDFLESNTEKFVKGMLAFARNPQPLSSAPPNQRNRTNEPQPMDHDASNQQQNQQQNQNQNQRQQQQGGSNSNGGLAKGMCRDYHMRGFCARGQACPYQHDAFATAQPPQPPPGVQPFSPFQFPFGPGGPQGPFPPGMRPGMPFPMGFPGQGGPGGGMPFGQPGFPNHPSFGGPPQPQNYNGKNGGPRNQPFNPHQQYPQQQQPSPQNPQSYPPPFPDQNQPQFPPHQHQRPPSDYPYRPQPSRRPPPSSSPYSRPQSYQRPTSTSAASTPKPPPELTALSEKLATNAAAQKELLTKFESVSADEKKGIMGELRRLNGEAEEIMIEKKKVEAEFELEKAKGVTAGEGGEKGDLKAHLEKLRSEAASLGILPGQSSSPSSSSNGFKPRPYPPQKRQYLPPRTAQSFKLDNRSTNILLSFPEESENVEVGEDGLREYFAGFGEVKEVRVEKEKREVFVGFAMRANAEKAMSSGPPPLAPSSKLRWAPATPAQAPTPSTATSNGTHSSEVKREEADIKMEEGEVSSQSQEQSRSVERARRDEDDDDERSWNR